MKSRTRFNDFARRQREERIAAADALLAQVKTQMDDALLALPREYFWYGSQPAFRSIATLFSVFYGAADLDSNRCFATNL